MTPREVFEALTSRSREAGTAGAAEARSLLASHFAALGYQVRTQPFSFQPAALNVLPVLGAGLGWLTLLEVPVLLSDLPSWLGPFIWVVGLVALGLLAWGIGSGVEIPGAERREDANLIATRGEADVKRWIVAHVDTKAQGHSMAGRLVAVWILLLAVAVLSGLVIARTVLGSALPGAPVAGAAGLALAAGVLAGRGRLVGESVGARDNGTGLLAALVAAQRNRENDIGYLLTGAEEFGMVGARVFVRSGIPVRGREVINLDTLTADGPLYFLAHDSRGRDLAERFSRDFAEVAPRVQIRRVPIGILVDSLPFARAAATAVTLSRLSWADLQRMHTPADTRAALGLETAEAVGAVVARLR